MAGNLDELIVFEAEREVGEGLPLENVVGRGVLGEDGHRGSRTDFAHHDVSKAFARAR